MNSNMDYVSGSAPGAPASVEMKLHDDKGLLVVTVRLEFAAPMASVAEVEYVLGAALAAWREHWVAQAPNRLKLT